MSDNIDPRDYAKVLAQAELAERFEKERDKLQAKCEGLETTIKANEKSIGEYEFGKKEYETLLEAAKKDKEEMMKKNKEQADEIEAAKKASEEKDKQMKDKTAKCEELEKELAAIKAEQESALRQSILIKEGVDNKEAEAFVKNFADLKEEQFKTMAMSFIDSFKAKAAIEDLKAKNQLSPEALAQLALTETNKKDDSKAAETNSANKTTASAFLTIGAMPKVKQ